MRAAGGHDESVPFGNDTYLHIRYRDCDEGAQVETGKLIEAKVQARHDHDELKRCHQNDFGIGSPDVCGVGQ